MNYGFNPDKIKILDEHWKLGSNIPLEVVNEDGDWEEALPVYEGQADNYETYGCTCYGTLNQIEIFLKYISEKEPNYSERYNYNIVGIEPPGADPQDVYESIRREGVIPQELLPRPLTLEEYKTPRPMSSEFLKEGQKWLDDYDFHHEWIIPSDPQKMKELIIQTLKYSPVAMGVTAWHLDQSYGWYVDKGEKNNHWGVGFKTITIDEKICIKFFDTYDQSVKILSPDHFVSFAKRISLKKRTTPRVTAVWYLDIYNKILNAIKEILQLDLKIIENMPKENVAPKKTNKDRLLEEVKSWIGKDASPRGFATNEVSCSEGASNILHRVFPEFPDGILSTKMLALTLDKFKDRFTRVLDPKEADIIVSPRTDTVNGHCGFFLETGRIVSNDSSMGLMKDNYSYQNWINYFKTRKGLRILLYKVND